MTERPIIFSGPMVRAILDGPKTQTRRILKLNGRMPEYCGPAGCMDDPTCWGWEDHNHGDWITLEKEPGQRMCWRDWCGAYAVGDRLYVRETCWVWGRWHKNGLTTTGRQKWRFKADNSHTVIFDPSHPQVARSTTPRETRMYWRRNSIHMPKWAARIWLTATEVRAQRLQDISEEDARAEGARPAFTRTTQPDWPVVSQPSYVWGFEELWDSIHGPGAFERNDWVAAISFERAP